MGSQAETTGLLVAQEYTYQVLSRISCTSPPNLPQVQGEDIRIPKETLKFLARLLSMP